MKTIKNDLADLVKKAVELKEKLAEREKEYITPLEEEFNALRVKLEREFLSTDTKRVEVEKGFALLIQKTSPGKLDEKRIAKLLKLEDLSKFKVAGKPVSFVQVGIKKIE